MAKQIIINSCSECPPDIVVCNREYLKISYDERKTKIPISCPLPEAPQPEQENKCENCKHDEEGDECACCSLAYSSHWEAYNG